MQKIHLEWGPCREKKTCMYFFPVSVVHLITAIGQFEHLHKLH